MEQMYRVRTAELKNDLEGYIMPLAKSLILKLGDFHMFIFCVDGLLFCPSRQRIYFLALYDLKAVKDFLVHDCYTLPDDYNLALALDTRPVEPMEAKALVAISSILTKVRPSSSGDIWL
ncbi:hypothetical protein M8C21_021657 [Ambrosia artemisiifolia]|uniref:Uncharacterized protein n=1 Tax=Ambrosia artemisiifolia TaxID=4212 RepID=A0AAD5GA37_AMBAR|nr:hypothetical protein M8C21_021657 [Ambrosia artemisiifolia]